MSAGRLPDTPRHLIWLTTGFIGDVLLSTAGIAAGIAAFPAARHHVVTTAVGAAVVRGTPGLASVTVFEKRRGGILAALRSFRAVKAALFGAIPSEERHAAVLLQVHLSFRSGFLARYLGVATVNFLEASLGGFATARVPRVAVLHETERVALLLTPLGVPRRSLSGLAPSLTPLPIAAAQLFPAKSAGEGVAIGIAPGSVWGTKRWLPSGFAAVAKGLLAARPDARVYFLGSAAEVEIVREVERIAAFDESEKKRVVDLAGTTSLDDLRRIFPRLSLLIANDSSQVHYASAFGVPTVAIFGPTVPAMGFGPLAPTSVALGVAGLSCRPCGAHGPMACPLGHFRCMNDLSPATVLQQSLALLS